MHKLAPVGLSLVIGSIVPLLFERDAGAHSIPRLYAELGPATAWDPVSARAFVGGTFALGLGVDPERDALLTRADFYATWRRDGKLASATGGSLLYRRVVRSRDGLVWTVAMGPGVLIAVDEPDLDWATIGVRGELGVRFGNSIGLTAFALTGLVVGSDVRVPIGGPLGVMLEIGAP